MKQSIPILLFAFFLLSFFDSRIYSQWNSTKMEYQKDTIFFPGPNDSMLVEANTLPEFPGGEKGLKEFIKNNTVYPVTAINDSIQGKVVVAFVIDSIGKVGKIRILRNVRSDIDNECIRIIESMPLWKPATQLTQTGKGWYWRPDRIWCFIPIIFQLHDDGDLKDFVIIPKKTND